eukprot:1445459-Amphidinium_carterae.1
MPDNRLLCVRGEVETALIEESAYIDRLPATIWERLCAPCKIEAVELRHLVLKSMHTGISYIHHHMLSVLDTSPWCCFQGISVAA